MNKITYLLIFVVILFGCNRMYIQVLETKSTNVNIEDGFYVYENDTIRLIYTFWAEDGVMSFAVFNKLKIPIYIDWKKSSYIDNTVKLDYWIDEEIIESSTYYSEYYYPGLLIIPGYEIGYTISEGVSTTNAIKVKPERITFVPPKSNYYRSQFYILPQFFYTLNKETKYEDVNRNDRPKRKTKVYELNYSKNTSPLLFRNFITYSLTEEFKEEIYIDNEFYLTDIKEMDYRHFKYKVKDDDGKYIFVLPFMKNTSFYLSVPQYKGVESRKKFIHFNHEY